MEIRTNGKLFDYGDVKEVNIYENGEILFSTSNGFLEEYSNNRLFGTCDRVFCLNLTNEIKRAIKVNLDRKDNFYVKKVGRYSFETGKAVYIHISEISVENIGEQLAFDTKDEKCYLQGIILRKENAFTMKRKRYEKIYCDNFTLPEGGKWSSCYGSDIDHACYDPFTDKEGKKGVVKRWFEIETISELLTGKNGYTRMEYSEERKQREKLADRMNELNIFGHNHISHYDIEKLLEYFDITEKEV